jgi:hypothetical protein
VRLGIIYASTPLEGFLRLHSLRAQLSFAVNPLAARMCMSAAGQMTAGGSALAHDAFKEIAVLEKKIRGQNDLSKSREHGFLYYFPKVACAVIGCAMREVSGMLTGAREEWEPASAAKGIMVC